MSQAEVTSKPNTESEDSFGQVLAPLPDTRIVQSPSQGNLSLNIPKTVREAHGVEKSDSMKFTLTSKGWFVEPVSEGDDG